MTLPVTSLLAGLFTLMMVPLSAQISARRLKTGVISMNPSGDTTLIRRIRAHGNFIEYAPAAVIAVGLVELGVAPAVLVWSLAAAMFFSRVVHAIGMLYAKGPASLMLRGPAIVVQHVAFLVAGGWLVAHALQDGL
jgi:uncharacterized membrane protein YecN with MAPEG domain